MKRILYLVVLSLLTLVFVFLFNLTSVFASTTTELEDKVISYTNSDTFIYNNTTYSIQDYKNSINNNSLFGSTMNFGISYYTVYSDDPIVKIIPKEYFYNVGVETYIGKEYGFFIKTVYETYYNGFYCGTSNNYRSYVIVFDIDNDTDLESNVDRAIFTVTNLFSLEYITISEEESHLWRKEDAMYTEYINYNYDYDFVNDVYYGASDNYCVVPLYDLNDNAKTNRYYLNDISFAGQLQNEQAYNSNDNAYLAQNDIGSYFTRLDCIYDGKYIVECSWAYVDYGAIAGIFIDNLIDSALSSIYGAASDGIEILEILDEGLSDKEYGISNDSYATQAYYVNRDDQISHYGYLTKCAYFALNTNSDLSILYEENDFARLEYTIGHSALGEDANLTRMTSEIALKIVDRYCNMISCATSSNDFSLREPVYKELYLGDINRLYLLPNGVNYFSFTPMYSGNYVFNVDSPIDLKVDFNGTIQQGSTLNMEKRLNKGTQYTLKVENLSSLRRCLSFDLDISTNTNDITVNKNNNFIVKVDSVSGFNKVIFNNYNSKLSVLSDELILLKNSDTNSLHYKFNENCYILIKNNTSNNISRNLSFTNNFSDIILNESIYMQLTNGESFYNFVPATSGKYSIIVFEQGTGYYNFEMYSDSNKPSVQKTFGSNFTKYDYNLIAGKTYYIGYENCTASQGELNVTIKSNTNIFTFFVDGVLVEGEIYMKQGQEFELVVKMNDIIMENASILPISGDEQTYISKDMNRNKYIIDGDAPTTTSYSNKLAVIDLDDEELEYITIRCLPNFNIALNNDEKVIKDNKGNLMQIKLDANKIAWTFESSNLENEAYITLEFTFGDYSQKLHTFKAKGNNGTVDLPALDEIYTDYGKSKAIATVKIVEIEFIHHWNGETYPTTFTNSYPNEPILSEKQVCFESVIINMMFNGGNGSLDNPFIIVNEWQLNNIRLCDSEYREGEESFRYIQSYFAIEYDITLMDKWDPIDTPIINGKIYGLGNNKRTIYNLEISETKSSLNVGFVRCLYGGSIEYLNFNNAQVTVSNSNNTTTVSIGIIAGSASGGRIGYCSIEPGSNVKVGNINDSTSKIGAKYTHTGGICGLGSDIYNCTNGSVVSSYGNVGGIAGYILRARVTQCSNSGSVILMHNNVDLSSDNENKAAGGIVGIAYGVDFIDVTNTGVVRYESKEKCKDKELAPRIGNIAGRVLNSSMDNVKISGVGNSSSNINIGNLHTENGFLGIGKYDQKKYTGYQYGIVE